MCAHVRHEPTGRAERAQWARCQNHHASAAASNLDAGLAGVIDFRFGRWHLVSDNSWVSLGIKETVDAPTGSPPPIQSITNEIDVSVAFGTVALGYELP